MISVLHINTRSDNGGATHAALLLHRTLNGLPDLASTYLSGRGVSARSKAIVGLGVQPWKLYANVAAFRLLGFEGPFNQRQWKAVEPLIAASDIVHLHNVHGYYMPHAVLESILRKKVVWTLHDVWVTTGRRGFPHSEFIQRHWMEYLWPWGGYGYPTELFDRSKAKAARMARLLVRERPVLVAPSHTMKDYLVSMGIPCSQVIYNGIFSEPSSAPGRIELRRKLGWPASKCILLFVSADVGNPVKGWHVLEQAIRGLERPEQWHVVIVGSDRHGLIRKLSVPVATTFLGTRRHDEVMTYFQATDLYVNPTLGESFGLTNLEALGAGADVLCSDLPVLRETAGSLATFFPQGSFEALAAALNSYQPADEAERTERAERIRDRFRLQRMTESYRALYEAVLANRCLSLPMPITDGWLQASCGIRQSPQTTSST